MSSTWLTQVEVVNPPTFDEPRDGPPRIWWRNGSKQGRTPGFFYTKASDHPDALPEPWKASNRYDDEDGYEAPALTLALIGYRTEPFVSIEENGQKRMRFLAEYTPGASIYTEWLIAVDDLPYPCVLCAKGLTGKALADALRQHKASVHKLGEKQAKRALPLWSFWMQLEGEKNAKGGVVFTPTGHGSDVTRPVLTLPTYPEADLLEHLFVGADVLAAGIEIRNEYADWLKERRAVKGQEATNGHAQTGYDHAPDDELDPTQEIETPW